MSSEEQIQKWHEQIKTAIKGNAYHFGSNREIRRLPDHLNNDENVISILTGSRMGKRGRGIIVATDERLFFLWEGWVFREHNDLSFTSLNSIEFKTGIFFGTIEAFSAGDSVAYNWVGRFAGRRFVKLVRQLSTDAKRKASAPWTQTQHGETPSAPTVLPPAPQAPQLSPEEERTLAVTRQLRDLKELLTSEIITPEEYELKRKLLVDSLLT